MPEKIVIVGCGGFGREVLDVVDAINAVKPTWIVEGCVDDSPNADNLALLDTRGVAYLGTIDARLATVPRHYVIGIGNGQVRRRLDARFSAAGWQAATLIHPTATIGFGVAVGAGSIVCAGARLTTNITLGRHTHINLNSTVGHDCRLGDYVTLNPLVAVSGWVEIGAETMIGTHAAILQNTTVGERSVVGGASLVTKPVPSDVVVKGVPAR